MKYEVLEEITNFIEYIDNKEIDNDVKELLINIVELCYNCGGYNFDKIYAISTYDFRCSKDKFCLIDKTTLMSYYDFEYIYNIMINIRRKNRPLFLKTYNNNYNEYIEELEKDNTR